MAKLLALGGAASRGTRREVEGLAKARHGGERLKAELARVNRELRRLKAQLAALEDRRMSQMAELETIVHPARSR